ncbi:MAG: DUF4249 family protein [Salinivirgaceae bacterium]
MKKLLTHIKNLKLNGLLILMLASMAACTEYIDMEPATYKKVLIVDATITNEHKQHLVKLSATKKIDEVEYPRISDALVTVSFNDTTIHFYENDTLPGYYYSDSVFAGVPYTSYQLSISQIDINSDGISETYTAEATMPAALNIDSVTYTYIPEWEAMALNCWALDPPDRNYYNFRAWKNDTLVTDSIYEFQAVDDLMFNGNYINGVDCQYLNDEKVDEFVRNDDVLTLEIENIDLAYFEYINTAISGYYGYNPMFGGLPANLTSNLSNDAMGIFRVYTRNKASVTVKDLKRENE